MDDEETPLFHKGNFRLHGSEEENKLVNKLLTQYVFIAAVPMTVVNFTSKALFKTVLKNPKHQQFWNIGMMVQAVLVTTFVFGKIAKRVSTEFPHGFMAQMRYLRTNPEALREFKEYKRDCKSGRVDYQTESLINAQIFSPESAPTDKTNIKSIKPSQAAQDVSKSLENRADIRYKLYKASLQAEPVPIMEKHTCFKARAALHEKSVSTVTSPEPALYGNESYLVLYDGPQKGQGTTHATQTPITYSRRKHAAMEPKELTEEERSAIQSPVGSYKLWRQETEGLIDPLDKVETCCEASRRLSGTQMSTSSWQTEQYDAEYQHISSHRQKEQGNMRSKQGTNTQSESQQNKTGRRNIYGDTIEPDVRWKNR